MGRGGVTLRRISRSHGGFTRQLEHGQKAITLVVFAVEMERRVNGGREAGFITYLLVTVRERCSRDGG